MAEIPEPKPRTGEKLADDIYQGLGGLYAAAKGIALQAHKRSFDDYTHGLERDKRIGLKILGHDVPAIDKEIAESRDGGEGEDVDSSVNISGDTHIHVAPGSNGIPNVIAKPGRPPHVEPEPRPQPATQAPQQPVQPPPAPNTGGMPGWAKVAIGTLLGAAVSVGPTAYFMKPTPPPEQPGGSIFRFDTELPPWMEENDAP